MYSVCTTPLVSASPCVSEGVLSSQWPPSPASPGHSSGDRCPGKVNTQITCTLQMCSKYDFNHKISTTVCTVHRYSLEDLCNTLLAVYEAKIKCSAPAVTVSLSYIYKICNANKELHPPTDHSPTHGSHTHPRPPTHLPQLFLSVLCQRQFPGEGPLIDHEESGLAGEVSHLPPALIGVRGEDILEGLHRQWRQYTHTTFY